MKKFIALMLALSMVLALAACGSKNDAPGNTDAPAASDVTLDTVVSTIKDTYGETYLPSEALDQDTFNSITGLTSDLYDEFVAEVPLMSTQADVMMAVKTQNVDKVKEVMAAYQSYLQEGALQYPMNANKVAHSVLYTADQYVVFFILGGFPEELDADPNDEEAYNAAEGEYFDTLNNTCIAALDALFA